MQVVKLSEQLILVSIILVSIINIFKYSKFYCGYGNHNIYIVEDPTPVDVDHTAHAVGPTIFTQRIMKTHVLKGWMGLIL